MIRVIHAYFPHPTIETTMTTTTTSSNDNNY